jgi:hypothetical protein
MNWLQIDNYKFEVIEDGFKYSGPLKSYQRNDMWSNFSYHTIKIKCPENTHLIGLRDKIFSDMKYKKDGQYYSCTFKLKSTRVLSDCRDFKIIKVEVEDINIDEVSKDVERDLKLSDLFEL